MKKIKYIFKEMFYLIGQHKIAFLLPIILTLIVIGALIYTIGPAAITVFIYAGV